MVQLEEWVKNFPPTVRLYLEHQYARHVKAEILGAVKAKGKRVYIVTDKTIFHPQGGGQPSDKGVIKVGGAEVEIRKVIDVNGVLVHSGVLKEGNVEDLEGEARLSIDWELRYYVMRLHTAGHLLDYAVKEVVGEVVPTIKAWHGPPNPYIKYAAPYPGNEALKRIEDIVNELVKADIPVRAVVVSRDELGKVVFNAPNLDRLPDAEKYRVIVIEGVNAIPCSGTHVSRTGEVKRIVLRGVKDEGDSFTLHYDVE